MSQPQEDDAMFDPTRPIFSRRALGAATAMARRHRDKDLQLFNRYPVLKIQPTTTRQRAKKPKVAARLTPTLTSAWP